MQKVVIGTLASAVADAGTFTAAYPVKEAPQVGTMNAGDFYAARGHKLVMNGALLLYPDDFDISFGATNVTVTNKTGATWAASNDFKLQLDQPGKAFYDDGVKIARTARSNLALVSLGAPDVLDADGIKTAAAVTTGYTAGGDITLTGALVVSGVVEFDVPRAFSAVSSSGSDTAVTLTAYGKDEYGKSLTETITLNGTTTVNGKKAFAKITRIAVSSHMVGNLTVGSTDILGLPFFLPNLRNVISEIINGSVVSDAAAVVLPIQVNATDLLAGTPNYLISPVAGQIRRFWSVIQVAAGDSLDDVGTVNLTVNGTAQTGTTLTSFGTAGVAAGGVRGIASADVPAANAAVAVGDAIGIAPSATWVSVGAANFMVEIVPSSRAFDKAGTFVAGIVTAGGSTATTGDVRGTYTPNTANDGSRVIQLLVSLPDPADRGTLQA
jgi:hypothetical protein